MMNTVLMRNSSRQNQTKIVLGVKILKYRGMMDTVMTRKRNKEKHRLLGSVALRQY